MPLNIEERLSDSPFVERIWRTQSGSVGAFTSVATGHWEMVMWKDSGRMIMTVRGPETKVTPAYCPENAEHYGIVFKFGTFMPHLPASKLVNSDINLPTTTGKTFWLAGSTWQFPDYENADTFVDWLVQDGLLVRDPVVEAALRGQPQEISLRSVQRRFLQTTGITHSAFYQIERARYATLLLKQGVPILDVVDAAGYADQPHLTRSLKRLIGQTPAQLLPGNNPIPLSFLFKTNDLLLNYDTGIETQQKEQAHGQNYRIRISVAGWGDGSTGKLALSLHQR